MSSTCYCVVLGIGWAAVVGSLAGGATPLDAPPQTVDRLPTRDRHGSTLTISYPFDESVFSPEIGPPEFRWEDVSRADEWRISVEFADGGSPMRAEVRTPAWSPAPAQWELIKRRSQDGEATVAISGRAREASTGILSQGRVRFRTSKDEVGASLFYREVNLPFLEAVQDPSRIRWCLGTVSSATPARIVLQDLPVCGNCHSFPRDGRLLAMDVDYANSKGSYVITPTARQMALLPKDIITWDDFRPGDGCRTFGLLSQISPDGQTVVSTVKDRSVFVGKPDLEFSQLFFPIKGILAVYRRDTRTFHALPGADDPEYVQSNPAWSPDGKFIVFARAKAHPFRSAIDPDKVLLSPEECAEFLKAGRRFRYDLYRIPYNQGQGGTPEPLEGASNDGMSNFFPKYSPDGRWIVFCKARSYMLLQPDSELYIIPADGGAARRMTCNTSRMNSWHSWSPNSRWLVFSSKALSPYTQLFLAHVDAEGNSAPPVRLAHLTAPDRAANIPEFVNLTPDAIEHIEARFLNDYSYARAGFVCERTGEMDKALAAYRRALECNADNAFAQERLGYVLCFVKGAVQEGLAHCRRAVTLDPANGQSHFVLGSVLLYLGDVKPSLEHLGAALELFPRTPPTDPEYTIAGVRKHLGLAFLALDQFETAKLHLSEAVRLDSSDAESQFALAVTLAHQGLADEAVRQYEQAVAIRPEMDKLPQLHDLLASSFAKARRYREAVASAEKAVAGAKAQGREDLVRELRQRLETYQREQRRAPP